MRPTPMLRHIRSFGVLASGQGLGALIPLLTAPILGRLYAPSDFGVLVLLMALASLPSVVATLQIHQGILVETSPDGEAGVATLCLTTTAVISLAITLTVGLTLLVAPAEMVASGPWLLLLPVATMQVGLAAISTSLANRARHYRFIAIAQALPALATPAVSIVLGFLGHTSTGLLFGYLAGLAAQIALHGIYVASRLRKNGLVAASALRSVFQRHRRFAFFTLPSELLLTITINLPAYALGFLGFQGASGDFGRARQISSIPPNAVIGAAGHVFRREALGALETRGECRREVTTTAGSILAVGIIVALPFWFYAPEIFEIYLGPSWRGAGEISQILIPMLVLRMAVSPVSTVLWLVGAQATELVLSVLSVVTMIVGVGAGYLIARTPAGIVVGYSIAYSILYLLTFAASTRAAKHGRRSVENSRSPFEHAV